MKRAREEEAEAWLPEELWTLIFEHCHPSLLLQGAPSRTTVRALQRAAPTLLARGIASMAREASPFDLAFKETALQRFTNHRLAQLREEVRATLNPYAHLAIALRDLSPAVPPLGFYRDLKRLRVTQLCNAWDCGKVPTGDQIFLAFRDATHWQIVAFHAYRSHLVHRRGKQVRRTTPYHQLQLPSGRSLEPQPLSFWRTKWGAPAKLVTEMPLVWSEPRVVHTRLNAVGLVDWLNQQPQRLAAREDALYRAVTFLQHLVRTGYPSPYVG